jgi:mRNA-degrading endonuclease YafQ of YafQ-DinJ toxin-antitoxin module
MALYYKDSFKKSYNKRFKENTKIKAVIATRIAIFLENKNNPLLRNHALKGVRKGYYAFSVTGDIRIIYYEYEGNHYLVDIGTHNQVYT